MTASMAAALPMSDHPNAGEGQDLGELDQIAVRLEASGRFKVLRKLVPRQATPSPPGCKSRIGIILDCETTGLDPHNAEIIELGMLKFRYSHDDEILGVSETFQAFNEPAEPIPPSITALTGITDQMVAGQKIDPDVVHAFAADANVIIAHNAAFDRNFAERSWPIFEDKPWACSMTQLDWRQHGFMGLKLVYLLAGVGQFYEGHRALDDCCATLEILSHRLTAGRPALATLLARARRAMVTIWAENSPYDLKDALKARGYRWNDGSNGQPRSWYIDVDEERHDVELAFLKTEIYRRDADIRWRISSAMERFSDRFQLPRRSLLYDSRRSAATAGFLRNRR